LGGYPLLPPPPPHTHNFGCSPCMRRNEKNYFFAQKFILLDLILGWLDPFNDRTVISGRESKGTFSKLFLF
jgi:hypothetical protein